MLLVSKLGTNFDLNLAIRLTLDHFLKFLGRFAKVLDWGMSNGPLNLIA
jgi:hypothetical protein